MESGWWAVGVAVVAALVAVWQAWEARRARLQARTASEEAAGHEQAALAAARDSAGAAQRSAEAQERLAAVAEAQLAPVPIWVARHLDGERWEVVNNTGRILRAWVLPTRAIHPMLQESNVDPGGSLQFQWGERAGSSSYAELTVSWMTSGQGDPPMETVITLQR